jgi:hypothetical protein
MILLHIPSPDRAARIATAGFTDADLTAVQGSTAGQGVFCRNVPSWPPDAVVMDVPERLARPYALDPPDVPARRFLLPLDLANAHRVP